MIDKNKEIVVALVLSGSGTDATAILKAWLSGKMNSGIKIGAIIVTNKNAGFLKSKNNFPEEEFPAPVVVLNRDDYKNKKEKNPFGRDATKLYSEEIRKALNEYLVDIVFYVGNIVRIIPDRLTYNIHPAKKGKHGGAHMYGLRTHRHVLDEICDEIWRERKSIEDEQYTVITVHEVDNSYDSGHNLLELEVSIPQDIIEEYYDLFVEHKKILATLEKIGGAAPLDELTDLARELSDVSKKMTCVAHNLQQYVLPLEWEILPKAVELAVQMYKKQ